MPTVDNILKILLTAVWGLREIKAFRMAAAIMAVARNYARENMRSK